MHTTTSYLSALGLLAMAASPVTAFWRLPCKAPLVVERADPIIAPGQVSGHVHTIMGGNAFGFTMTYPQTQTSTCSSCTVKGDMSNYWTPHLFYQFQNGSFTPVQQVGGATVYYLQRNGTGETLKAFPEGFRMVAGNPFKRSGGTDFASQAISYACLNYNAPATPETPNFPTTNCPDGLRAQVFFPSCWDGVNLDSADHESHMSYPATSYNSGSCPSSHPVHLISLFYEVTWNVDQFQNQWYGSSQPFVWAMGDPTGYGFHGDFVNGWNVSLLQSAVDQCTDNSGNVEDCPVFNLTPDSQAEGCKIAPQVNEVTTGILPALPGCNPVTPGPAMAAPVTNCSVNSTIGTGPTYYTDLTTTKKWSYTGCGTDDYYNRTLKGASTSGSTMTVESCVDFCVGKGFTVAGMEYADECYCDNSIPSADAPIPGVVGNCQMACAGNSSEYCGGSGALSLYQKCTGSTCVNAQYGASSASSSSTSSAASTSTKSTSTSSSSSSTKTSISTSSSSSSSSKSSSATTSATSASSSSSSSTKSSSITTSSTLSLSSSSTKSSGTTTSSTTSKSSTLSSITSSSVTKTTTSSTTKTTSSTTFKSSTSSSKSSTTSIAVTVRSDGQDLIASTSLDSSAAALSSEATATTLPTGAEAIPTSSAVDAAETSDGAASSTFSISPSVTPAANVELPSGWEYAGCYSDNVSPRSLKYWASFSGTTMSSTKCVAYCLDKGFPFAGTENAGQCFCGDILDNSELMDDGDCSSVCKGADDEICGGPDRLSLFTSLAGDDAANGTETKLRHRRHMRKHRRGMRSLDLS